MTEKNGNGTEYYEMPTLDLDWVNKHLRKAPALPKITWKKNGWTYTATDLRYLKKEAVDVLTVILQEAARDREVDSVVFKVSEEVSDDDVQVIIDIVLGIRYSAKSRHGEVESSCFLCNGTRRTQNRENKTTEVTFYLNQSDVEAAYDFAHQGHFDPNISFTELIEYMAKKVQERFDAALHREEGDHAETDQ